MKRLLLALALCLLASRVDAAWAIKCHAIIESSNGSTVTSADNGSGIDCSGADIIHVSYGANNGGCASYPGFADSNSNSYSAQKQCSDLAGRDFASYFNQGGTYGAGMKWTTTASTTRPFFVVLGFSGSIANPYDIGSAANCTVDGTSCASTAVTPGATGELAITTIYLEQGSYTTDSAGGSFTNVDFVAGILFGKTGGASAYWASPPASSTTVTWTADSAVHVPIVLMDVYKPSGGGGGGGSTGTGNKRKKLCAAYGECEDDEVTP